MKNKFYKKSFTLMIVTILCQVINLGRDILLARSFGASSLNDTYLVSQTIVSVIITMINSPMATAFVPVTTKYYVSETVDEKNKFVSKIYSDIFLVAIGLSLIEIIGIDGIVAVAAPGFSGEARSLLKKLVLIQTPITLINIIKGVNRGNFQILQKFTVSEITCVFPYFCMCVYLLLPIPKSIYMIAIVLSGGTIISIIPELIILYKSGFRYRFSLGVNNDIKQMFVLMVAAAVTAGIREINVLCDKAIGSLLSTGSITMLSYASKLTVVIVGLVTASISLVGFANIAKLKNEGKKQEVLDGIVDSCNLINFLIIPLSVYMIIFSYDIIKILYFGGGFDLISVSKTANLMKLYAIGLAGYGFQDVYTRTLHAYKIVRCTIKESALMVSINIALNLILSRYIGAYGVAIATSVSILVVIPILGNDVKKNVGNFNRRLIVKELIKTYGISVITGLFIIGLKILLNSDSIVVFFIETLIYGVVYLGLCLFTKNKILKNVIVELKK
jgi:putative peptidoglycan lipid II flippase